MLPPSLLAKNRLFVERDPKHRRITSNLGLTFRNSKWSHYARTNVNVNSKNDFLSNTTYAFTLFLVLVFLISSSYLYNTYNLLNPLASIYWFAVDTNLYFQLILSSSFFYFAQNLVSWLHLHFMSLVLRQPTITPNLETETSEFILPKRLYKPSLYALLRLNPSTSLVTSLFETNQTPYSSLTNLEFIKLLYKTVFLTRLASNPTPFKALVTSLDNNISTTKTVMPELLFSVSNFHIPTLNTLAFDYTLFNAYTSQSTPLDYRWTLTTISRPNTNTNFNLNTSKLRGLFYVSSITQDRLNYLLTLYPELSYLRSSVENQMNAIRWNKWLYNYSLLHRSSLKTNMYLNLFKTHLTDVPYDPSLNARNVWLPESFFTPVTNKEILRFNNLYSSLYSDTYLADFSSASGANFNFYNKSMVTNLSFYESSFNWALGRFYFFNGLSTNSIFLKPQNRNQQSLDYTAFIVHSNTNLNFTLDLLRLSKLTVNKSTLDISTNVQMVNNGETTTGFSKDEYSLAYTTASLFSKERLVALNNISSNTSRSLARQNNQAVLDSRLMPLYPKSPKC